MGWLITAGALTLLAILPVGVSVIYNTYGPLVRLMAGPIRLTLFPVNKEKKKEKHKKEKPKKEKPKKTAPSDKVKSKEKKGGSFLDFLPLVETGLNFLGAFRRKLRVNRLEMKLVMAGDDPCDLAVNYGKAWAAVGNLMPQLERLFVIRKRNVEVECDFTAEKTLIFARLDITITVGRVLAIGVYYGVKILRQYLKIMKMRKGGAKQ